MTTIGIVLAAGRSERMGRVKALLPTSIGTLLERAVRTLRTGGCTDVVVVVNENAPAVHHAAAAIAHAVVAPDTPDAVPLDSLRLALAALPADVGAVVVLPVDCPLVLTETVTHLIDRFLRGDVLAVVPVWRGTQGHPVVLGSPLFDDIHSRDLPEGLRTLLGERSAQVALLDVADPGITVDLDTPEDAQRHGVVV
jgi:CTP:molybdopterin cytidylyltransferase MocA